MKSLFLDISSISAKGSKREVFGMPIPGSLITSDIQIAFYYQEYLANVDKHKKYMAGKTGSYLDSPASKPTKTGKKPKSTAHKAPPRPSVSIPVTSAQTAPTSAPAKPQEKKRKQATKMSDKPPKAKKSKLRRVTNIRSLKSVAASEAEEVPNVEPQVADEDADYQKALEESMKTAYALPRGLLPPVVIKEPESRKYQPLLEVPRNGKAKVIEEQIAHDLLSLEKPKKKSPAEQYIFQRRISEPAGSSLDDDSPYDVLGQSDSKEDSEKVMLEDTTGSNDEDQARPDTGAQAEGQNGTDVGTLDEGQAGSNPDEMSEGQADHEHVDLDVADVSSQPSTKQLGEGFTATVYPKVQENLKLTVEEQVLLEELASSSRTLSFLQHLSKDISFGDQFFSNKPLDADKSAETKVESMVNVSIQQAMSSISLMTSPIIDLTSRPESPKEHQQFKATTTDTTTTTTTTLPPPQAQQQSTAEAMMVKRIGELEHIMANLIQVNKEIDESEVVTDVIDWAMQVPLRNRFRDLLEADMKEILHQRMWETESYKTHEDHKQLFEVLEKSMNPGLSGPSGAPGASGSSPAPPAPPHPPTNQESSSKGSAVPSLSKTAASAEYQAKTITDVKLRPSIPLTPADLEMDEHMGPDEQAQLSDDKDVRSAHIPKVSLRQDWWKPLEEERPATPEPTWSILSSDAPVLPNNWASALASNYSPPASNYSPPPEDSLLAQTDDMATFIDWFCKRRECHKLLTDCVDDPILRNNVSKPLPLGGLPGQMKAAYYLDAGLEQMVLDQFWIDKECKYDIAAMYDYMKKIVLRRADRNEHVIAERDLKYLYPSDFEDLYLLNLQEDFQLGIESYQTQLNLTKPQWDATGFKYKHDYTIIDSPRAAIFRDKYGVQVMMRFNEIHNFGDGTLQQIDEALDYRVK
nr:hypothetical protein [Tanacetum cinerariifolium]